MSSFRTSTVPEWSMYEQEGYFSGSGRPRSNESSPLPPDKFASTVRPMITLPKQNMLAKDLKQAEYQLKLSRLGSSWRLAMTWQLMLIVIFNIMCFEYNLDFNIIWRMLETLMYSVVSVSGILFGFTTYCILFFIAANINCPERFSESYQEQIHRLFSIQFIHRLLVFGVSALAQTDLYVRGFDTEYSSILISKGYKWQLHEEVIVVYMAGFMTGVEFFVTGFLFRQFRLKFPSTQVKRTFSSINLKNELTANIYGSLTVAFLSWIFPFVMGPLIYSNTGTKAAFSLIGVELEDTEFGERMVRFLDIRFMIRICFYVYITRLSMNLYLKIVNASFTEIMNLPIENPLSLTNNPSKQVLMLGEAMKGDNMFLKYLSFYEFKIKARLGSPEVMIFFNLTHPGSHPVNWRSAVSATQDSLAQMNGAFLKFLKTATLPPTLLESGFQPYILSQIRPDAPGNGVGTGAINTSTSRLSVMRDLTLGQPNDLPAQAPTVVDLLQQMPVALWTDLKAAFLDFASTQHLTKLVFNGKYQSKMPEKQIANIVSASLVSFWAMEGTIELICISVDNDARGIVHPDLKMYTVKILETFDILTILEFYMTNGLENSPELDRQVYFENKMSILRMINMSVFVLSKIHAKFSHCYSILDFEPQLRMRIGDIISSRV